MEKNRSENIQSIAVKPAQARENQRTSSLLVAFAFLALFNPEQVKAQSTKAHTIESKSVRTVTHDEDTTISQERYNSCPSVHDRFHEIDHHSIETTERLHTIMEQIKLIQEKQG